MRGFFLHDQAFWPITLTQVVSPELLCEPVSIRATTSGTQVSAHSELIFEHLGASYPDSDATALVDVLGRVRLVDWVHAHGAPTLTLSRALR